MSDIVKDAWTGWSDDYYKRIYEDPIIPIIKGNPWRAFPRRMVAVLQRCIPDLKGRRVLVPSSGDNKAAFGFHLLGAHVTSADISERQIENARRIALENNWLIDFICADSMGLEGVENGAYDLVYTSNGVHVWIDDLKKMYQSFHRALKPGGLYTMFETHPFCRPFDGREQDAGQFKVAKTYEQTGPFGEVPNYGWRIQDLVNVLVSAGFTLSRMEEFHPEIGDLDSWWYKTLKEGEADGHRKFDWTKNPWAALPQWIGLCAVKRKD